MLSIAGQRMIEVLHQRLRIEPIPRHVPNWEPGEANLGIIAVRSSARFLTWLEMTLEEELDLVEITVPPGRVSFAPDVLPNES